MLSSTGDVIADRALLSGVSGEYGGGGDGMAAKGSRLKLATDTTHPQADDIEHSRHIASSESARYSYSEI